jgi:hypothetical protein
MNWSIVGSLTREPIMTRAEKLKALQEMDRLIEHADNLCTSYELAQMEMMTTVAQAKAMYKQLIAKKVEPEKLFDQVDESATQGSKSGVGLVLRTARLTLTAARSQIQRRRA